MTELSVFKRLLIFDLKLQAHFHQGKMRSFDKSQPIQGPDGSVFKTDIGGPIDTSKPGVNASIKKATQCKWLFSLDCFQLRII